MTDPADTVHLDALAGFVADARDQLERDDAAALVATLRALSRHASELAKRAACRRSVDAP